MTSYQQIVTSLSFFLFIANLQQSGSRIPDAWSVKVTFALIVTFYITKTENKTKKSVAPLSSKRTIFDFSKNKGSWYKRYILWKVPFSRKAHKNNQRQQLNFVSQSNPIYDVVQKAGIWRVYECEITYQISSFLHYSSKYRKKPIKIRVKKEDDCVKTLIPYLTLENSAVITTLMNFLNFTLRLKVFPLHSSPQQYYLLNVWKLWIWSVRKGHFNRILKNH